MIGEGRRIGTNGGAERTDLERDGTVREEWKGMGAGKPGGDRREEGRLDGGGVDGAVAGDPRRRLHCFRCEGWLK